VLFHRDVDNVTTDLSGVESIHFEALGGADNVVVNDLSGTNLWDGVTIELEGTLGSGIGDGQVDTVTINAPSHDDTIIISSNADTGGIDVRGGSTYVGILHPDATDQLVIYGRGGVDYIDASKLQAGQISLTLHGAEGEDTMWGSQGDDVVIGGRRDDTAYLGPGNDTFVWNPGDGNDLVEGQDGVDALLFNGSNANENIDIHPAGTSGHVLFSRDVGNVTTDIRGVEGIIFNALGGADNIAIEDVSGTDLALSGIAVDLAGAAGGGDGAVDTVTVNGRDSSDTIAVSTVDGVIFTTGSPAPVAILNAEANDQLIVNGSDSDDTIDASALTTGTITLTLEGGGGLDTLIGSAGNDVLVGGAGHGDSLSGGGGKDTFVFTGAGLATLDTGNTVNSRDVIEDFGADVIDLQQIDAEVTTAGDQAFSFIGKNAFTAAGQVHFFTDGFGNTIVEGNVDSNLSADFQIELHAFTAQLRAGNFLL
jgi:Ca2+-binding RTX toxin-like protein